MRFWFLPACLSLCFVIGCDLSTNSSGGSGKPDGVATRSAYTAIEDWDSTTMVATLSDGFRVIVVDGTFQRDSCSWQNTPTDEFLSNVRKGQLAYYTVYIDDSFKPGEPLVANQFTVVNLDCFKADPCTCGCEEGVQ